MPVKIKKRKRKYDYKKNFNNTERYKMIDSKVEEMKEKPKFMMKKTVEPNLRMKRTITDMPKKKKTVRTETP